MGDTDRSDDPEFSPRRAKDAIAFGGEDLEDYCKKHGLCVLCAQTRTHKRVFRLSKKNKWQPLEEAFYVKM